jgi:hypothetical protein
VPSAGPQAMMIDRRRSRSRSSMSTCRIQDAIPATPFLCPLRQIGLIDTGNVATYPAKKKQKFSPQAADRKLQVAAGKKPSTVYMQGVWSEQHNGIPAPFCLVSLGLHALQLSDIVASGTHRQWDTRCGVLAVVTRSGVVDDECARAHGNALATWVTRRSIRDIGPTSRSHT